MYTLIYIYIHIYIYIFLYHSISAHKYFPRSRRIVSERALGSEGAAKYDQFHAEASHRASNLGILGLTWKRNV